VATENETTVTGFTTFGAALELLDEARPLPQRTARQSTLAKLYLSGVSAANLAERYGTSERQITKLMQLCGMPRRGRGSRKPGVAGTHGRDKRSVRLMV